MASGHMELGDFLAALDSAAGESSRAPDATEPVEAAGALCQILDVMEQVSLEGRQLHTLQLEAAGRELENRYARHTDGETLRDRARDVGALREQLGAILAMDRNELTSRIQVPFASPHLAMPPEFHEDVAAVVEAASRDIASVKEHEALCKWLHSASIPDQDLKALASVREQELQRSHRVLHSVLKAREAMRVLDVASEGTPATRLS
ncbi:hypothetical protein T484DRAFT_2025934 [Baffinella frigidus]|nr:hypothetical protein T484DRAFT_2025934 [Cryptophyta sp. CCMP2293]|mmetsp:Transcript_44739/g.106658  ORF Transcript_44739/g.106658 Transcript_44739/m.106658 type:complete len:207 (+) Transcript_44739:81-701(+)